MKPIRTDPKRTGWMLTLDGQYLCPECIAENQALVDWSAEHSERESDTWAVIGYCGDKLGALTVNSPRGKCAHCEADAPQETDAHGELVFVPDLLDRWKLPGSYFGATWEAWFTSGFGQSRDSDALERSNFRSALKRLGGESETVRVIRESHWAVGWVEWIGIHQSDTAALRIGDELRERYENYPILDEEDHSELEDADCAETWDNCYSPRERLEYLKAHCKRESLTYVETRAACRKGGWGYAANLLPCPSDLLH